MPLVKSYITDGLTTEEKAIERAKIGIYGELPCKPTLDWNFAEDEYKVYNKADGFVTAPIYDSANFTRSTVGTFTDPLGGVSELGVNKLRRTFDPVTGESLGALIEEQRTNILLDSQDFGTSNWGVLNLSQSRVVDTNLFEGGYDEFTTTSTSSRNLYHSILSNKTNDLYANTFVFNIDSDSTLAITLDSGVANADVTYNPTTGELTKGSGVQSASIINISGWLHLTVVVNMSLRLSDTGKLTFFLNGSTTATLRLRRGQVEKGPYPTSYIKTEGAGVTRTKDSLSRVLGDEFNSDEFTVYIDTSGFAGYYVHPFELRFPNGDFFILSLGGNSNDLWYVVARISGVDVTTGLALQPNKTYAVSLASSKFTVSSSAGELITKNITGSFERLPTVNLSTLTRVGDMKGIIKRFAIFPRAFDEETLQRLTEQGL